MSASTGTRSGPIVVIGFGNTFRRDDGAGPRLASIVSGWESPGVEAIEVHQLTPELAERVAKARLAIFVDVRLAEEQEGLHVQPVNPNRTKSALGHVSDPRMLLALARMAYGASPRAWLLTIPATDFGMGEGLSPTAERGLEAGLQWIALQLREELEPSTEFREPPESVACTRSG